MYLRDKVKLKRLPSHMIYKSILLIAAGVAAVDSDRRFLRGTPANGFLEAKVASSLADSNSNGRAKEIDPNDLGYRFQKFTMEGNIEKPNLQYTNAYPLSDAVSKLLRFQSDAYSVVTTDDYRMKGHDVTQYIVKVGGYPARPGTDEYWDQFRFVCQVQKDRREGNLPNASIWTPPVLWASLNVTEVAERVHDEYPGDNQATLLFSWFANRRDIQLDYGILPFRCLEDFIGTEVRLAALNTWAITTVAPINFAAKWHVGQIRPEEMAWRIANGTIPGVPEDVNQTIMDMNLTDATSFTHYPEGCPNHPSWPAMHSAASSMSLWLPVIANLTKAQYCQVLRTDYAVSFARTIAGVHYPEDNYAGLNMGQAVIARELPQHLAKTYGADITAVRNKIGAYRFDWRSFNPATACGTVA